MRLLLRISSLRAFVNVLVIGVTGGIGSGKTAVTDEFTRVGITIVDADVAARTVVANGKPAFQVFYWIMVTWTGQPCVPLSLKSPSKESGLSNLPTRLFARKLFKAYRTPRARMLF